MTNPRKRESRDRLTFALLSFVTALLLSGAIVPSTIAQQPDGKIVFSSARDGDHGSREIYVMNTDGTNQVRLTNNNLWEDFPEWSPDGQKIAFLSHRTDGTWAIFTMNKDGTGWTEVTQVNVPSLDEQISWSPDGRRLAFHSFENGALSIFVVNADGTDRQICFTNGHHPSWSPDGSKILFSTSNALYTVRPDGSDLRLVITPDFTWFSDLLEPGWSSDGQHIIFVGPDWVFEIFSIFTARADGTDRKWVAGGPTVGHATTPDWSPDGGKFVYTGWNSDGSGWSGDIFKANINGSGHTRLTTTGNNYNPSLQPSALVPTFSVSGRVTTPAGPGLRNAAVTLTDSARNRRTVLTSTLGYYSFDEIPAGETVTISAASRRYRFQPVTRTMSADLSDVDLIGIE